MKIAIDPESLYVQLGRLVAEWPELSVGTLPDETHRWLGRVTMLVEAAGDGLDVAAIKVNVPFLGWATGGSQAEKEIKAAVYRALARAEAAAPAAVRDSFIPAGSAFDALAAVGKVLQTASRDVLIVDPYMDEKALTTFAVLAPEGSTIRLLADEKSRKTSLRPAVAAWNQQHGPKRPAEARLAAAGTLHDRAIIVDGNQAWTLTQSLNAFAARSPASIVRVDAETAALKVAAYELIWSASAPI